MTKCARPGNHRVDDDGRGNESGTPSHRHVHDDWQFVTKSQNVTILSCTQIVTDDDGPNRPWSQNRLSNKKSVENDP